jgi:uncharacterized phage protein (TIGR01671 family)
MRDIKFRGKREFDCEWVFGDLLQYESGEAAIFSTKLSHYGCEATEIYKRDNVIPETIGQYTGLTDKNGKEIYEGDIIKTFTNGSPFIGEVYYEDAQWFGAQDYLGYAIEFGKAEIIGNQYENPELLEGQA